MKKTIFLLLLCGASALSANAQSGNKGVVPFDQILREEFPSLETGAAVLVSRRGRIIYKKAVGKANLETGQPMQTDHVFRIASITKQFTAIAILQLMEQGKLQLQDEITRYLPDYPVQGARITIEHLLTHTSGIRDYASIRDTVQRGKLDLTPEEVIRLFWSQPLRFAPGTRYEYSNSNYFLLGYLIEKITGKSYPRYLDDHFFGPLGMKGSSYASASRIIRNRAAGYTHGKEGLENAAMLSMTQPYAAGGILSTVEDLYKWNQAMKSYRLVKKETLEKAFTRYRLANNQEVNYGYGFRFGFIQESPSIWHGGLINGFMTMSLYLPKEDVYVVALSNCNCVSPERAVAKLAAAAIGKPYAYREIDLAPSRIQSYAGVYENEGGDQLLVSEEKGRLYAQRGHNPKMRAKAFSANQFFFDDPMITLEFRKGENGPVEGLLIKSRNGKEVWTRTDKPLRGETVEKVDEQLLDTYCGQYEVSPQFQFAVTRERDRLFLQANGQEKLELFAEADRKFFLKVNDARLEFINESGRITKVILRQGGRTTEAQRSR